MTTTVHQCQITATLRQTPLVIELCSHVGVRGWIAFRTVPDEVRSRGSSRLRDTPLTLLRWSQAST